MRSIVFEMYVTNSRGQTLNINDHTNYSVIGVDKLDPPETEINIAKVANLDGGRVNSVKLGTRALNIELLLMGDIEQNRIQLYKYFQYKKNVKINYKNRSRNVCIDGYVEFFEAPRFESSCKANITIICADPFFKDVNEIVVDASYILAMFEFPFAIENPIPFGEFQEDRQAIVYNGGDVDTGAVIELNAFGRVVNPKIFDKYTGEFIGLNITLEDGDSVTISTQKGGKSVSLHRNGVTTNVINTLMRGHSWLQLKIGENAFVYEAEDGLEDLEMSFVHVDRYVGV